MKPWYCIAQCLTVGMIVGSSIPYIRKILAKQATPSRASWIVWTLLDCITLGGMLAHGVANAQIVTGLVMTALITAAIVKTTHAMPWAAREKFYLILGLLGIALWIFTENPTWAILISLGVIELALWATLETTWKQPWGEPPMPWLLSGLAGIPILATLPTYTLESCLQPIVWMTNNLVVVAIIFYKRRIVPHPGFTV